MNETNIFDELTWRGLVQQVTSPELREVLGRAPVTCYIGFDPSADSLHVGHLLQILLLVRMQRAGHRPIALLGGATGMIGDPSGKSEERNLLELEQVQANLRGIRAQLERFLDTSGPQGALIQNNYDWLSKISFLEFLRTTGKCFSVNAMMDKDSVRTRLEQREQGISFTEFSYQLLQAHDFLHLYDHFGCTLQLGGSDQWGNITGGVELIRRQRSAQVFGLTSPLLTTADGRKLGKTERGAVWLDARRTSVYQFYQYWMRIEDRDVIRMLKMLTMRSREEIASLEQEVAEHPERRVAQRTLAHDMTALMHGEGAAADAKRASEALFGSEIAELDERMLLDVMAEAPSTEMAREPFVAGKPLVDVLAEVGLCASKSAARKDIKAGAISINNVRVEDPSQPPQPGFVVRADQHTLAGRYIVLRRGKKSFHLIKLV